MPEWYKAPISWSTDVGFTTVVHRFAVPGTAIPWLTSTHRLDLAAACPFCEVEAVTVNAPTEGSSGE